MFFCLFNSLQRNQPQSKGCCFDTGGHSSGATNVSNLITTLTKINLISCICVTAVDIRNGEGGDNRDATSP